MRGKWVAPLRERDVTREIARAHFRDFERIIESEVIVVGAGPAGMLCARDLAADGMRVLVIEQHLALGGGFWSGGYLMNKAAICAPAHEILQEIGIPCTPVSACEGMYLTDPPHATARLIASLYESGAHVLNLTTLVDLILRDEGRLEGIVVNSAPVEAVGHDTLHIDPIALESKIVVDATGHDASVVRLLHQHNCYQHPVPGNGAMWVSKSEELVVEHTGEIYPHCFVVGLAVAAVHGTPRMGPAFGAMLLSGRRGAQLIRKTLKPA